DRADDFQLGKLAARHLDVNLVDRQLEERGKHRRVTARPNRARLVIAEAQARRKPALADNGLDGAVENVHEAFRILLVRVATHRGFIDGDLVAAGLDQPFELHAHDGEQRFGERPAVLIPLVGRQPAAEGVGTGNAGLERDGRLPTGDYRLGQTLEARKILDRAEAARGAQFAADFVLAALVVRRRTEAAGRSGFHLDTFEEPIEAEIEVEPRLLAVGDDIEPGIDLVANGDRHGIIDQLRTVGLAEHVEVRGGKLQPAWKRVAADDGRPERGGRHEV